MKLRSRSRTRPDCVRRQGHDAVALRSAGCATSRTVPDMNYHRTTAAIVPPKRRLCRRTVATLPSLCPPMCASPEYRRGASLGALHYVGGVVAADTQLYRSQQRFETSIAVVIYFGREMVVEGVCDVTRFQRVSKSPAARAPWSTHHANTPPFGLPTAPLCRQTTATTICRSCYHSASSHKD